MGGEKCLLTFGVNPTYGVQFLFWGEKNDRLEFLEPRTKRMEHH
jgi:hypothetical protein